MVEEMVNDWKQEWKIPATTKDLEKETRDLASERQSKERTKVKESTKS